MMSEGQMTQRDQLRVPTETDPTYAGTTVATQHTTDHLNQPEKATSYIDIRSKGNLQPPKSFSTMTTPSKFSKTPSKAASLNQSLEIKVSLKVKEPKKFEESEDYKAKLEMLRKVKAQTKRLKKKNESMIKNMEAIR